MKKSKIQYCSNTGGEAIKRYAYDQRMRPRESLTMKELEEVTHEAAYSEEGKFIFNLLIRERSPHLGMWGNLP